MREIERRVWSKILGFHKGDRIRVLFLGPKKLYYRYGIVKEVESDLVLVLFDSGTKIWLPKETLELVIRRDQK